MIDPMAWGTSWRNTMAWDRSWQLYDHGYGLLSRADASGNPAYYTFQAIGHTSESTDATGGVLNTYSYDPFGMPLGRTDTVANPFKYVGE